MLTLLRTAEEATAATTPSPQPGLLIRLLEDPYAVLSGFAGGLPYSALGNWAFDASGSIAVLGAVAGMRLVLRARQHRLLADGARLIEIQMPPAVAADSAAAFWSHLHALLRPAWRRMVDGQPHLVFEFCFDVSGARVGIWVPGVIPPGVVEAAVESAWPGARTTVMTTPRAPLPHTAIASTGGRLRLAKSEVLPLHAKFDSDPLRALLGAGAGLHSDEYATVQVLARPTTGRRLRSARHQMAHLRYKASGHRRSNGRALALSALDEVTLVHRNGAWPLVSRMDPAAAADLRSAVGKMTGSMWETEVRYAVASTVQTESPRELRARVRGVADAIAATFGVFAERNWWARKRLAKPVATAAARAFGRGNLLSVAELAALAHLPLDPFALGVARAGARSIAPPPAVAAVGSEVKLMGDADTGPARPIGLKIADARQHTHILGATGSGKSTLMGRMILDDITAGRGVVVIDPKGDLVTDLLGRLPAATSRRLALIDPSEPGPRATLNVLAAGDDQELLVDNLVGIFHRIYAAHWGPRTDDVLRAALLTLLATADAKVMAKVKTPTLADVPDLLTNNVVRRRTLSRLPDSYSVLHGFWDGYDKLSEAGRAAVVAPLLNKLRAFLLRDFVHTTVSQPASTIDLREVLDGGILLVRLPKGMLGEETARLLGSFIVAATWQAASARAKSAEGARIDSGLYLDEAHNFLNLPIPLEDMLAEARGYRLSLALAHQNLAQMPSDLREGISANTRNKVFFTCSPEDARTLATHTAPMLSEHDLSHLAGYQAAARLNVDGAAMPAFTLRTRPLPPSEPELAERSRLNSRASTTARHAAIERLLPGDHQ
ncbi:DUF87 domain-containing protein [Catenulispora sp. NL8]|uniref:DUF87 domain-containing protein n=1 Tax=Catenulispora pinistramenti TaxID=2705254 RepID=A0ABS5KGU1_9ACTN|nr:DUF87 domain-containing protein [Catenulispora pinistramenti]MBS2545522.1 DUF87 domain-containing protein [Catenulispora pinistramenti]